MNQNMSDLERYKETMRQLKNQLPFESDHEQRAKRLELWQKWDKDQNGYLTLEEAKQGMKRFIKLPQAAKYEPKGYSSQFPILSAYNHAKTAIAPKAYKSISECKFEDDHVSKNQFVFFIRHLRFYYECLIAFCAIDANKDEKLSRQELKSAIDLLKQWNHNYLDAEKVEQMFGRILKGKKQSVDFLEFYKQLYKMDKRKEYCEKLKIISEQRNAEMKEKEQQQEEEKLRTQALKEQEDIKKNIIPEQHKRIYYLESLKAIRDNFPFQDINQQRNARTQLWNKTMQFTAQKTSLNVSQAFKLIKQTLIQDKTLSNYMTEDIISQAFEYANESTMILIGNQVYMHTYDGSIIGKNEFKYFLTYMCAYLELLLAVTTVLGDEKVETLNRLDTEKIISLLKRNGHQYLSKFEFSYIFEGIKQQNTQSTTIDKLFKFMLSSGLKFSYKKGAQKEEGEIKFNSETQNEIDESKLEKKDSQKQKQQRLPSVQTQTKPNENQSKVNDDRQLEEYLYLLRNLFPFYQEQNEEKKRQQVFEQINRKLPGFMFIDQAYNFAKRSIKLPDIFSSYQANKVIKQAYQFARSHHTASTSLFQTQIVSQKQFRYFLRYLQVYLEIFLFLRILKNSDDNSISLEQVKKVVRLLEKYGHGYLKELGNVEELFKSIKNDQNETITIDKLFKTLFEAGKNYDFKKLNDLNNLKQDGSQQTLASLIQGTISP